MIRINDASTDFERQLKKLCEGSPYGARIESYFTAYSGRRYSFLEFWLGEENGVPVCAICRYYSAVTICGAVNGETADFVRMLSPDSVLCGGVSDVFFAGMTKKTGETLVCTRRADREIQLPSGCTAARLSGEMRPLRGVYDLLRNSFDETSTGSFDDFFVDLSHRIRHGVSDVYAVYCGGDIVSTLTVTAKTDTAAVLGSIATKSDRRREGLAGFLVSLALNDTCKNGRQVFLHREKPISVYERAGFETVGAWSQFTAKR